LGVDPSCCTPSKAPEYDALAYIAALPAVWAQVCPWLVAARGSAVFWVKPNNVEGVLWNRAFRQIWAGVLSVFKAVVELLTAFVLVLSLFIASGGIAFVAGWAMKSINP
jgi:hypothetical protein